MNILEEIVEATKARLEEEGAGADSPTLYELHLEKRSLAEALMGREGVPVIAEVKPRSPSRGDLRSASDPAEVALQMVEGGAAAISVLTEPRYFGGSLRALERVAEIVSVPVLMKDFIIDEKQILRGAEAGADAILLMVSICPHLESFYHLILSLGLEPLVEVHSEEEVEKAARLKPWLIGINNRDLETMKTNLTHTQRILPLIKARCPEALIVAESGVRTPQDVKKLLTYGADAVLVGTAIMESRNIAEKVKELVGAGG